MIHIKHFFRFILILKPLCIIIVLSVVFSSFCLYGARIVSGSLHSFRAKEVSAEVLNRTIVIDAGHGGEDGGTVGVNGVLEKELNLLTSKDLYTLFKFAGYDVLMTRTEDEMLYDKTSDYVGKKKILDLAARLRIIEETNPDLFLSIHMNSFPQEKYSGLTVYFSKNTSESANVASLIQNDIKEHLQPENDRETKAADKNIYLLDRASCPAILIECGFLSNREECKALCDPEYRKRLSLIIFSSAVIFVEKKA